MANVKRSEESVRREAEEAREVAARAERRRLQRLNTERVNRTRSLARDRQARKRARDARLCKIAEAVLEDVTLREIFRARHPELLPEDLLKNYVPSTSPRVEERFSRPSL